MSKDIEAEWREYLRCCNERRFGDLGAFVHEQILFNDKPTALNDYAEAIRANIEAVPDFRWQIEQLVVSGDTVAVRLLDTGTPVKEWLGFPVTGRSFSVREMAFYRFQAGRIEAMWFVLDTSLIASQLKAG